MSVDFIGIDEETRKIRKDQRLTIGGEDWGGVRLVRVTVQSSESCEDVKQMFLRAPAAVAAGHAMINAARRQPLDDTCERWIRGAPFPGGDWLDRVRDALEDPRATSEGHKETIRACRLLVEELDRMRAAKGGASRPYSPPRDLLLTEPMTQALVNVGATEEKACDVLARALQSTRSEFARYVEAVGTPARLTYEPAKKVSGP